MRPAKISSFLFIFIVGLSGCASLSGQKTGLSGSAAERGPASQTQVSHTAGLIYAALQNVEQQPGFWFSKIQAVRIVGQSQVDVELMDDSGKIGILSYRITQTKCGLSDCPLEAEQIK